jgi:hypothetical protein
VPSCQDDVDPLAGQRQLMLKEHLDVLQPGIEDVLARIGRLPDHE